jgi:hypothetical protein
MRFAVLLTLAAVSFAGVSCAPVQETTAEFPSQAPSIPSSAAVGILTDDTPVIGGVSINAMSSDQLSRWNEMSSEEKAQVVEFVRNRQLIVAVLSSPSGQSMEREGSECCPYIGCKEGFCGTLIEIKPAKNCCVACACCLPLCAIGTAYNLACCPARFGVWCCKKFLDNLDELD